MFFQDLGGVFGAVRLSIGISYSHIYDAVCTVMPKTSDEDVATVIIVVVVMIADYFFILALLFLVLADTTGMDFWFVVYLRVLERLLS